MAESPDAAEADYTWTDATKDLALGTSLTLREAGDFLWMLRSQLDPYLALPHLVRMLAADATPAQKGAALSELLQSGLAEEGGR